jgi:hypothetical protein
MLIPSTMGLGENRIIQEGGKMQKVSVPYTKSGNRLLMQELRWPKFCICCMKKEEKLKYLFNMMAEKAEIHTDVSRETSGYNLSWNIPYCFECQKHAGRNNNLIYLLFALTGILWTALGYYLFIIGLSENTIAIILFVATLAILIFIAYQINKLYQLIFVKAIMKKECANKDFAIESISQGSNIVFTFHNDEYARLFLEENITMGK